MLYTAKFRVAQAHHRHFFEVLKMADFKGLRLLGSADQRLDLEDGQEDGQHAQQDQSGHYNDK